VTEEDRHSRALEPEIISDPVEKARKEAANGLRQIDAVNEMIEAWLQPDRPFKLRLSHILHLHRFALEGLSSYAGNFRPAQIEIGGSKHQPVEAFLVPEKIEELCDYVNQSWRQKSPIHLAAYVLWRLNWIHPFYGWKWKDSARPCVLGPLRGTRHSPSWNEHHSRTDLDKEAALLCSSGSCRPGQPRWGA